MPSPSPGWAAPTAASVAKASVPTVSATQNERYPRSAAQPAAVRPAVVPSAEKLAKVTPRSAGRCHGDGRYCRAIEAHHEPLRVSV